MFRALASFLGLNRHTAGLMVAIVLIGMGQDLWVRFVPEYIRQLDMGKAVLIVATYQFVEDFLESLYYLWGGRLAGLLGARRGMLLFSAMPIVGYSLIALWESAYAPVVAVLFISSWANFSLPATFSLISSSLKSGKRTMGFGVQSVIKRLPKIVGPLLGGYFLAYFSIRKGVRAGACIAIAMALASILVQKRFLPERKDADSAGGGSILSVLATFPRELRRLMLSEVLARFGLGMVRTLLVVYVCQFIRLREHELGWMFSLQMLAAVLTYIPVSAVADRGHRKPFISMTFFLFALFPLAIVFSTSLWMVAIAFAIGGLREIGEPSRKAAIVEMVPQHIRTRATGVYWFTRQIAVAPAPLLGALLWKVVAPEAPFVVGAGIGLCGAFLSLRAKVAEASPRR